MLVKISKQQLLNSSGISIYTNSHRAIYWKIISTNVAIASLKTSLLKQLLPEKIIASASLSYRNNKKQKKTKRKQNQNRNAS